MERSKLIYLSALFAAVLCVSAPAQASNGGKATNIRVNGQTAVFYLDDGERYAFLTVTRDEIADTTWLSYAYRFPDLNHPNWSIQVEGDGEIPNSAFTVTSTSAQLTVTTTDSYPVIRCVINNESGEYTCASNTPSTFDLTWTADRYWTLHEILTNVETFGTTTTRVNGRLDEVSASVSGTWDGHSGSNLTGYLTDSRNATLFREVMMAASPRFLSPATVQAGVASLQAARTKGNIRYAFTSLEGDGLGFLGVLKDEIANTTNLRFGYAFPDPSDSSTTLFFQGGGEIPNDAFTITSASARLTVTTPDSVFVLRCVITGIIGDPGAITCAPATSPVTFDLTWIKDGYGSVHGTSTRVETLGSVTTRYHRQYNKVTANASGTWTELNEHAGTNMIGYLTNLQDTTIEKTNP